MRLVGVHFASARRREVLWWCIAVVVEWRGLSPGAVLTLLVGGVGLVEGEVVLGWAVVLAVASAFGLGDEELLCFVSKIQGIQSIHGEETYAVVTHQWLTGPHSPFGVHVASDEPDEEDEEECT